MVLCARGDLIRSIRAGIGTDVDTESSEKVHCKQVIVAVSWDSVYQGPSEEPSGTFLREAGVFIHGLPWVIV